MPTNARLRDAAEECHASPNRERRCPRFAGLSIERGVPPDFSFALRLVYLGIRARPFNQHPAVSVVYRLLAPGPDQRDPRCRRNVMKGHVKKRGDRYHAVIYEGRDPVTGKRAP
jgi:hypothetical protein